MRLVRTATEGRRHPAGGSPPKRINDDRAAHGERLSEDAAQLAAIQLQRRATLGVDPKLVLVFELKGAVIEDDFRRAGLRRLDARQKQAVVAFADDPQLQEFRRRVEAYREGPSDDAKTAPYEAFIDVLGAIRPYGPDDRRTKRLEKVLAEAAADESLLVDFECWHPDDPTLATSWLEELEEAVTEAGGEVLDPYQNDPAGLLLMRGRVPAGSIEELVQLDQLARIDGIPEVTPSHAEAMRMPVDRLPAVTPPADDAPLVAMIDSGVKSAHPLISPALADATTVSDGLPDGDDAMGHGTRIAGLLLHGRLDPVTLERDVLPAPPARLLSVRVLDADNKFPSELLWERELEQAIRYCHEQGARVINLSIGDRDTRYRGSYATPVAGLLDELAKELKLVIVVPTGNVPLADYAESDESVINTYPITMLEREETTLLDPAPAALALTVGATCTDGLAGTTSYTPSATKRPIGAEGWPAPYSRRGPGVGGAIKPELSAAVGSLAWDYEMQAIFEDRGLGAVSTSGRIPERLLDVDLGTSFAAPVVSHVAAGVVARYPGFGPNLVRALVLLSAEPAAFVDALDSGGKAERHRAAEKLVGYGTPHIERATHSDAYRAVLVAEASIPVDGTHVYEVPIPSSFFESGGKRGIDVALSFDPRTRIRRLDYMACKMVFWLVRGLSPERIEEIFLNASEEELEEMEDGDGEERLENEDSADQVQETRRTSPSKLGREHVEMEPKPRVRSLGANQLARRVFAHRLPEEDGDTYHLVVQCRGKWASTHAEQDYGLAVCLWRDPEEGEVYEEIEARIEVPVELEIQR